jgi:hypothetical protein
MRLTPQAAVTVGIATVAGLLAPTASADGSAILGGGAGIIVSGTNCTLTTIGHDGSGELVGFTAGSCGGTGAPVMAEASQASGPVGTVAFSAGGKDTLDYAVIKFDPGKVVPINNSMVSLSTASAQTPRLGSLSVFRGRPPAKPAGPSMSRPSTDRPA